MDIRSQRIVDLLQNIKTAVGQGDICEPQGLPVDGVPDIEVTVRQVKTGQTMVIKLWQMQIEQWRDVEGMTMDGGTITKDPTHLKLIGDIASIQEVVA